MSTERPNQIIGVARILAATDPVAWGRLLAEHIADASGHCRACRPSSGASPVWPCSLRMIGEEAERMSKTIRQAPPQGFRRR